MIDATLKRSLRAIRDGEIVESHLVRPIIIEAQRAIDAALVDAIKDAELLDQAKAAFLYGWEPEFLTAKRED